jgi:hypothetical protein
MVGPFPTIEEAEAWMGLCGVPAMFIHQLEGPIYAIQRGNAQMENWQAPFGFKEWAEGKEPKTSRRYNAERKGYRKETRRQVP